MTLKKFKSNIKLASLLAVLIGYSLVVFVLGRYSTPIQTQPNSQIPKEEISRIQKPLPQSDVLSAKIVSSSVKICSNTAYSYQVAYPNDWFTTYNKDQDACMYFAPFSFILPEVVDRDITPITIKRLDKELWDQEQKSVQNPNELYNIVSSQNIQTSSRPATLTKAVSTGSINPKGFLKVTYLVEDSNNPLEITYTQQNDKENTDDEQKVLDQLVESLKFF